jgi:hypothetical protein
MRMSVLGVIVSLLLLIAIAHSSAVIDSAMVEALWLFDDGAGTVVRDSSGNGRHGNIEGGTQWVAGKYGGALQLNGVDGEVVITGYKGIGGTAGRTTVLWYKSPVNVDGRLVCWGANATAFKYHIRVHVLGDIGTLRVETQGGQLYSNAPNITDDEWHHLAVVLPDGSDMCHKHLLYVDGVLLTDLGGSDVGVDTDVVTNDVEIGYDKNIGHGGYANGAIDEVAIFNVALTEEEINLIMLEGLSVATLSVSPGEKIAITWGRLRADK